MVEGQHEGRGAACGGAVGGHHPEDRLGLRCEPVPEAERREQPLRGQRQRIGAAVEARLCALRRGAPVHDRDGKAVARQREGEGGAVQPASGDQDVGSLGHGANMAGVTGLSSRRGTVTVAARDRESAMDRLWMTAAELGRGIEAGRIHPVELAEAFLAAAADHPEGTRIYARLCPTRARTEAMAAAERAKRGLRRGPLDGVPVSWKDLFDTAGVATEAGSALLKGRVPAEDAAVLGTATLGGLVCLGKTHMSELAFSGLGLNPVTATPPA